MLADVIAQIPSEFSPVMQLGIAGSMLLWFMFRVEPRMKSMEDVIADLSKAILLDVATRDGASHRVKLEAEELLRRTEARNRKD